MAPEETQQLPFSYAAWQVICADTRRVILGVLLEVVADIPKRAVVAWVDVERRIVFPSHGVRLRRFAFRQHGFTHRHLSFGVSRHPREEIQPVIAGQSSKSRWDMNEASTKLQLSHKLQKPASTLFSISL
jgi:hypothetical protein